MRSFKRLFLFASLSLSFLSCSLLTRLKGADTCDAGQTACVDGDTSVELVCVDGFFEQQPCANGDICTTDACAPNAPVCGDNAINGTEECDGADVGGASCVSEGFAGGTLACNANCTFDTSACDALATCGDNNIDNGEQCDGNNLNGQACNDVLAGTAGTLTCNANCTFNTTQCVNACGNGAIDAGEDCDGNNLGGNNCGDATNNAFPDGTLACDAACQFNTAQCGLCGDGIAQLNETCDDTCGGNGCNGSDNGDGCSSSCQLEQQGNCNNDNNQAGGEFCDGTDLNNKDCGDFGFAGGGTLACSDCNFDTSTCVR